MLPLNSVYGSSHPQISWKGIRLLPWGMSLKATYCATAFRWRKGKKIKQILKILIYLLKVVGMERKGGSECFFPVMARSVGGSLFEGWLPRNKEATGAL